MEYNRPVSIKCPMCGTINKLKPRLIEAENIRNGIPFIFLCDNENGGCDRWFVAKITLQPTVKTATYTEATK